MCDFRYTPSTAPSASSIASELKYALLCRSKTLSGSTTDSSRASAWNRATTGLPSIGRASSKCSARWSLQKYGVSNNSCSRITWPPLPAAARTARSAESRFSAASGVHANWVAANVTFICSPALAGELDCIQSTCRQGPPRERSVAQATRARLLAGLGIPLHALPCLGHVDGWRNAADGRNNLAARADDECRPLRKAVIDFRAARVLHSRARGSHLQA